MAALTRNQRIFRDRLAARTDLNPNAVGAWMLAEESGGAAKARERQGNQNWLNVGYFDSGPGAVTKAKAWSSPETAADETAAFLSGRKHGAAPGIRAILNTAGQSPRKQLSAIAASPWASSHYGGANRLISLLNVPQGGRVNGTGPMATAASSPSPEQGFDQAGFEKAQRLAIVGRLIASTDKHAATNPLLTSGLLPTEAPNAADFQTDATASSDPSAKPEPSYSATQTAEGLVVFRPGADRQGVHTQPIVKNFLQDAAGRLASGKITVGTGTNHNQMTTSGNVSDHWTGRAADIPEPVDSRQGDNTAAAILIQAGVKRKLAHKMARQGGLFNVTPTSGPYKGHRVQVIWKSDVGGNHHNHVHVGIR